MFNAEVLLVLDIVDLTPRLYGMGEQLIVSQDYVGAFIKAETSIMIGFFEIALLSEESSNQNTNTPCHHVQNLRNQLIEKADLGMHRIRMGS